jgi:GNAT superfamily N-acetyltransferase
VAAFQAQLTLSPEEVAAEATFVLEGAGELLGFYRLNGAPPHGHLEDLFVEPAHIGHGHGRTLWDHALATAREMGFESIELESDPHAEAFYLARGAVRVGEVASPGHPDRILPVMRYELLH